MENQSHFPTPFRIPPGAEEELIKQILAQTCDSPLFAQSVSNTTPFTTPDAFWDVQYNQILNRKSAPAPVALADWLLKPALACACCLMLIGAFYYQPHTQVPTGNKSALVEDFLTNTTSDDALLLVEEEIYATGTTSQSPVYFDDEDLLF